MIVAERPTLWQSADRLKCPECGHVDDAYRFRPLAFNPATEGAAVPVRKCPKCRFLFAPLAPPEGKHYTTG